MERRRNEAHREMELQRKIVLCNAPRTLLTCLYASVTTHQPKIVSQSTGTQRQHIIGPTDFTSSKRRG